MEILVVIRDPSHAMMNRRLWSWVLGPEMQKDSPKGGKTGGVERLRAIRTLIQVSFSETDLNEITES